MSIENLNLGVSSVVVLYLIYYVSLLKNATISLHIVKVQESISFHYEWRKYTYPCVVLNNKQSHWFKGCNFQLVNKLVHSTVVVRPEVCRNVLLWFCSPGIFMSWFLVLQYRCRNFWSSMKMYCYIEVMVFLVSVSQCRDFTSPHAMALLYRFLNVVAFCPSGCQGF